MSLLFAACAQSEVLIRPPTFYVDSRDATDDGTGRAIVTDRVNGWTFPTGTRFKLDTALIPGTQLLLSDANGIYARRDASGPFGGTDASISAVVRIRPSSGGYALAFRISGTDGWWIGHVGGGSPVPLRIERYGLPTGATATFASSNHSLGSWYTYGFSYLHPELRIYRDGVYVGGATLGSATVSVNVITLGANFSTSSMQGYYAAWKGWAGVAISDAQHAYEHSQLAAWAA